MGKTIEDLFWYIFRQEAIGLINEAVKKYGVTEEEARLIMLNTFQMMWRRRRYCERLPDNKGTLGEFRAFLEKTVRDSSLDFCKLNGNEIEREIRQCLKTTRVLLAILGESRIPFMQMANKINQLPLKLRFVDYLATGKVPKGLEPAMFENVLRIRIACHQPAVPDSEQPDDALIGLLRESPVLHEILDHRISEILNGIFRTTVKEKYSHFRELTAVPENLPELLIGNEEQLVFVQDIFDQMLAKRLEIFSSY